MTSWFKKFDNKFNNILFKLLNYLLKHTLNKQLFLWYLILKKVDHVCKDYRKSQSFGWKTMAAQKKMFSGLSSAPYGHMGFTVSLKPSLNLRPFKWANCSFKRDNNFNLIVSWTLYKEFSSFWVIINFLNLSIDFAFLISELKVYSIGQCNMGKMFYYSFLFLTVYILTSKMILICWIILILKDNCFEKKTSILELR